MRLPAVLFAAAITVASATAQVAPTNCPTPPASKARPWLNPTYTPQCRAQFKLLFGDAEPGGRLPITFPADETQGPATKTSQYPGTPSESGGLDTAHFDEGIFIGYRFWDQYNQRPLFP